MSEERNYTVYMHVCKENGKTYVGITGNHPEKRWRKGNGYNHNKYFTRAIKKYGWDNFEHIVLFKNKTKQEAEELEILFIKSLLSNNSIYGYNIDNGGNSTGKMTEKTRKKLSESHKGQKAWNKGIKSLMARGCHPQAKKVSCDNIIFDCAKDCAEYYKINVETLYDYLNGKVSMPQEFYNKGLKYLNSNIEIQPRVSNKGGGNPRARKVICDNMIFDCLTDCAKYYNINITTMGDWVRGSRGMPVKFYEMDLKYLDSNIKLRSQENSKNNIQRKVICENEIFNSIKNCADYYKINYSTMSSWLQEQNRMPQKYKDVGLSYYIGKDENDINNKI